MFINKITITANFLEFFLFFSDIFPYRIQINADPDPQPWQLELTIIKMNKFLSDLVLFEPV